MKKKFLFFLGSILGLCILAYIALRFIPVPKPAVDVSLRVAALNAVQSATQIHLGIAEHYLPGAEPESESVIPAPTGTRERLIALFGQDETYYTPVLESPLVTVCFIPRHKIECVDANHRKTTIYICFECSNFSVNDRKYKSMINSYRSTFTDIFAHPELERPRNTTANHTKSSGHADVSSVNEIKTVHGMELDTRASAIQILNYESMTILRGPIPTARTRELLRNFQETHL